MIKLWAEKEFHNLRRLQKAGIPSPKPLLIKKHVLVMSFIGHKQSAAPKLKHTRLSYEQWVDAYEQVVDVSKSKWFYITNLKSKNLLKNFFLSLFLSFLFNSKPIFSFGILAIMF